MCRRSRSHITLRRVFLKITDSLDSLHTIKANIYRCSGTSQLSLQLERQTHHIFWTLNLLRQSTIVPNARIIMILRDPIERAFSHYLMNVREKRKTLPFYEILLKDYSRSDKGYFLSHMYVETGFLLRTSQALFRDFCFRSCQDPHF